MGSNTVNAAPAPLTNGVTSSPTEDEELHSQLSKLRELVLAGKHAQLRLPLAAIEQLKLVLNAQDAASVALPGSAHTTTLHQQLHVGQSGPAASKRVSGGLDPIFLEKSDSLVRAEGQLKRQRIERDLQAQVEQRKHVPSRESNPGPDGPSRVDVDAILLEAQVLVPPVSGLKPSESEGSDQSFDENDYYSSQVQSAFTANYEPLEEPAASSLAATSRPSHQRALSGTELPSASAHSYIQQPDDDLYEPEDDDEYSPPDAGAFDSFREEVALGTQQITPADDDNSDYEPGEVTQESAVPVLQRGPPRAPQPSPFVPVIRNHLTHIAAPQPNRVSPLATAKGPSSQGELALVNGRPEVIHNTQPRSIPMQSRVSSASPSGNAGVSVKKRRNKKRKRDQEPGHRVKKRRERESGAHSPTSPTQLGPYIKDEPLSPPPYLSIVPQASAYQQRPRQHQLASPQVNLLSPGPAQPQLQYAHQPPRSASRYEYAPATSPAVAGMGSPSAYRPSRRDTQDLRRVASMQYSQRLPSPRPLAYSPVAPYRAASLAYGTQPTNGFAVPGTRTYEDAPDPSQYARAEQAPSSAQPQEDQDEYAPRAQSPATSPQVWLPDMVIDQFGNRYLPSGPTPPTVSSRAPAVPFEGSQRPEQPYERAPSRMQAAYARPAQVVQYGPAEPQSLGPPPQHLYSQFSSEHPVEYVESTSYKTRAYSTRPAETPNYAVAPHPSYQEQQPQRYEPMGPPPAPAPREATSSAFAQRAYSVRPEELNPAPPQYLRQASVAPAQYARQEMAPPPAPARAMSVVPAVEYGGAEQAPQQRVYSYASVPAHQSVRYVDQYGNEVFPRDVRQVSEFRY